MNVINDEASTPGVGTFYDDVSTPGGGGTFTLDEASTPGSIAVRLPSAKLLSNKIQTTVWHFTWFNIAAFHCIFI